MFHPTFEGFSISPFIKVDKTNNYLHKDPTTFKILSEEIKASQKPKNLIYSRTNIQTN